MPNRIVMLSGTERHSIEATICVLDECVPIYNGFPKLDKCMQARDFLLEMLDDDDLLKSLDTGRRKFGNTIGT